MLYLFLPTTEVMLMKIFKRKNGQSLVEFAIIAPILIIMLVSIVDFGFLLNKYIVFSNATREAVRYGITKDDALLADSKMKQIISDITNIAAGDLVITIVDEGSRAKGTSLKVTVAHEHTFFTPVVGALFNNSHKVTSSAEMMIE
jgi:Flp pilus assembly protein TadG